MVVSRADNLIITQDAAPENACGRGTGNKYIISHCLKLIGAGRSHGLAGKTSFRIQVVVTLSWTNGVSIHWTRLLDYWTDLFATKKSL